MPIVKSKADVARYLGISYRTVQNWARAGMPRLSDGRYDSDQVETWLKEKRYLGATFRAMASDKEIQDLFGIAVLQLRRGLQSLCQAYVFARGKGRIRLIERALSEILHTTMQQASLLETKEGEHPARPR
jgi:hypothetical protein